MGLPVDLMNGDLPIGRLMELKTPPGWVRSCRSISPSQPEAFVEFRRGDGCFVRVKRRKFDPPPEVLMYLTEAFAVPENYELFSRWGRPDATEEERQRIRAELQRTFAEYGATMYAANLTLDTLSRLGDLLTEIDRVCPIPVVSNTEAHIDLTELLRRIEALEERAAKE
jgi:hypothetical protein